MIDKFQYPRRDRVKRAKRDARSQFQCKIEVSEPKVYPKPKLFTKKYKKEAWRVAKLFLIWGLDDILLKVDDIIMILADIFGKMDDISSKVDDILSGDRVKGAKRDARSQFSMQNRG